MIESCKSIPAEARRHVYIFFVNGLDPVNLANLSGLRDYVQDLGYGQTYFGQLYHTSWFASELWRIHAEDGDARFVLIGFDLGSHIVHALAKAAQEAGVNIDLMVFLTGHTAFLPPADRPTSVQRLIVLTSGACSDTGDSASEVEEHHHVSSWHFAIPAHPTTLQTIADELLVIASRVPIRPLPLPPPVSELESAPTPRPVPKTTPPSSTDEWDFLKLETQLSPVPGIGS
jgi:hypothetical protein